MRYNQRLRGRIVWLERLLLRLDGLDECTDHAERQRRVDMIDDTVRCQAGVEMFTSCAAGASLDMLGISVTTTAGSPTAYRHWIRAAKKAAAELIEAVE